MSLSISLALVVIIAICDYLTGADLSFTIFYLFPVVLITWTCGRAAGIVLSVTCALAWLGTELLTISSDGLHHPLLFWLDAPHLYSRPWIPFWNALASLCIYLIITYILASLRALVDRQVQMTHFLVHDLRSPLTNVLSGMQTLQAIEDDRLDAESREIVGLAVTSGNRMLSMINSLLDSASLSRKHMQLECQEVTPASLIHASLAQVSLWASQNDVRLRTECPDDAPSLYADPEISTRVLVNVLGNAIKYSPGGSEVLVRIAPHDEAHLAVSVIDHGPGIPPEWADKVFDRFAQVEGRKAGALVGTGLGLAFSRLAVEAQGGKIWLESEVGHGTTVTFTLPIFAGMPEARSRVTA